VRRGPSLSFSLLSEIGEGDLQQGGGGSNRRPGGGPPLSTVAARKARRKQERVDKSRRVRTGRRVTGVLCANSRGVGRASRRRRRRALPCFVLLLLWLSL
jgi:hypothetical protein